MRHSANLCPSYHPVFRHCSGIVVLKSKAHPPVVSIDIPRHLRLVTALFFGFLLDNREWVRWCNRFHPLVLSLQGVYQEVITIIRFALGTHTAIIIIIIIPRSLLIIIMIITTPSSSSQSSIDHDEKYCDDVIRYYGTTVRNSGNDDDDGERIIAMFFVMPEL